MDQEWNKKAVKKTLKMTTPPAHQESMKTRGYSERENCRTIAESQSEMSLMMLSYIGRRINKNYIQKRLKRPVTF